MTETKKLIIVQSPADMVGAISILKSFNSSIVEIAVIGSIGLFKSITSYHSKVLFLSPPALSKGFFKYICWFYLAKKKNIDLVKSYDEIFYPDLLNDVMTSVLVKIAKKENITISKYASRYNVLLGDNTSNSSVLAKVNSKVLSCVLNMVTGMKEFEMVKYNDRFIPYCTIKPDNIYKFEADLTLKRKIDFELTARDNVKFLFLDPGPGIHDILCNYSEVIPGVLKKLSNNGHLYIKKHPTHPLSVDELILDQIVFSYLNENLPISMIDLEEFNSVIAIESIGLAEVDNSFPISIIKLFEAKNNNYINTYIKYLTADSAVDIFFPNDMDSFESIVCERSNL